MSKIVNILGIDFEITQHHRHYEGGNYFGAPTTYTKATGTVKGVEVMCASTLGFGDVFIKELTTEVEILLSKEGAIFERMVSHFPPEQQEKLRQ